MIIFQRCHHTIKFTSHKSILVTNSTKSEAISKISVKFHFCSHAAMVFIITRTIERCHRQIIQRKHGQEWHMIAWAGAYTCTIQYLSFLKDSIRWVFAAGLILFNWTSKMPGVSITEILGYTECSCLIMTTRILW